MIPRIIHRIWFGSKPIPSETIQYFESQDIICREYTHILWEETKIKTLHRLILPSSLTMLQDDRLNNVIKSDILRYEVLRLFGGIYLDTDVEVLRSFDDLLNTPFFCAWESHEKFGTAIIGSIPYHPITRTMSVKIYSNYLKTGIPKSSYEQLIFGGPYLFTDVIKQSPSIRPLPRELFYPYGKPEIPATVHYFVGGQTKAGWTHKMAEPNTCNRPKE
jgi:hypothetical protein